MDDREKGETIMLVRCKNPACAEYFERADNYREPFDNFCPAKCRFIIKNVGEVTTTSREPEKGKEE